MVRGRQVMAWNKGVPFGPSTTCDSFGCVLNRFCANSETSKPAHLTPVRSVANEVDGILGTAATLPPLSGF